MIVFPSLSVMALSFFISSVVTAEIIVIQTINGTFRTHKEEILQGPEGFLKSAYHSLMKKNLADDGSFFVNVDERSMRYALSYIRHRKIDRRKIRSSPLLMNDFQFLFPGLIKEPKKKAQMVWVCAAFCDFERPKPVKFMSTTHRSVTTAWQNLIALCRARGKKTYLVSQVIHESKNYQHALSSMGNSCTQITTKIVSHKNSQ